MVLVLFRYVFPHGLQMCIRASYHSSRWLILESQKGSFKLQTKMSYVQDGSYYPTSYYKYLSASGTGNGANVYQYSYNALGDGYSDWYFEPVNLHPQSGGYYCIRNKNSGKYLTHVPSNNTVIQSEGTGRGEQTWHLVRYSDGFWTLRPITATSTYFLDVNGSYSTTPSQNTYLSNYTPVTVFNNGSTAYNSSRWKIAQGYDGSYTILAKMSYVQNGAYYDPSYHKFLSLSSSTSNQNIFQFSHTGGDEEWYFDFVSGSTKVYQSQKYPGLEVDGSLARDMGYNDKTRSQIIAVSEKLTTMLDVFDNYGPTEVYNTMMGLATTFTKNDASLTPVATDMFNHFWNGSGADYRNPVLTQKAVGHPTTQTYINGSKALILQSIRSHNGDITKVPFDIAVQSGHEYLKRPQFTTEADLYNGLKICINDTWGQMCIRDRCMCSCLLITVTEFVVGVIVNIKCRMDVWNYSRNRFQYKGQVCLLYSFFWFLLSIPALWISSGINRHKIKKTSLEAGISFKKEEYRN